ncbi:MAG: hypothetical protein A2268_04225 [Candidatus Raymondbacteria bacterium RifOxyA12_full_50_37]|uniref:Uncharacterized protein n=1 Tax=Candidatus Raymondbacteria bacterium RIFOXYD12_FULL_49_13 TaxID=1817890 RepID=A0A1F7FBQ3_UNCRA|nr:MAG: hypothetical protein A2268_04225 [Candidatus Raymondbacteria bacterium RifOxyA12_full_50_37]OGJ92570.1 MAG: hypothetical protein A2248_05725 [Candidatus Raymondbacteria bacterium RIFOXYA2_FULL_49_16]OGJ92868.1 MAG: hypothetical protein A2350_16845 [Candidatus Raymondbacteria bacterium RifOxyB12_full_50_8]OGJ97924.1 MAG: hypothetical protein A2453_02750 [Candidatus Raymondbacteria bacterium RIFOXYC2_FULL_50_21]OGK03962.1 MAG: hypothetical protein A2519_04535 [Candidatus Raymondbacteria b
MAYKRLKLLIIWEVLLLGQIYGSTYITISSDKKDYLVYDPIYLTMEFDTLKAPANFIFGSLENSNVNMVLVIETPSGILSYTPPETDITIDREAFRIGRIYTTEYATIVLHRGMAITSLPGKYLLFIRQKTQNKTISNKIQLVISEPVLNNDTKAMRIIKNKPEAYALFIYLEGGEHIKEGFAILKDLCETNSSYTEIAKTVLMLNYSERYYDWKQNKIEREIDFNKVEKYLNEVDIDKMPEYLKLRMCSKILRNTNRGRINNSLFNKLNTIKNNVTGSKRVHKTRLYNFLKMSDGLIKKN